LGPIDLHAIYNKDTYREPTADRLPLPLKDVEASTLTRWQSQTSGLSVVHVDFPSPIVSLYAVVRTEIFTDKGESERASKPMHC
jgi:hypothetical protein